MRVKYLNEYDEYDHDYTDHEYTDYEDDEDEEDEIEYPCPNCGEEVDSDDNYCSNCGADLSCCDERYDKRSYQASVRHIEKKKKSGTTKRKCKTTKK